MIKAFLYDWYGVNASLFLWLNHAHAGWYDAIMLAGSMLGKYTIFPLYYAIILFIAWTNYRQSRSQPSHVRALKKSRWINVLVVLILAYALSFAWVPALKEFFFFPRPFVVFSGHEMVQLMHDEMPYTSFPSGHTSFAMLMAAGLWPILGRYGRYAAVFYVLWVGVSRIALGMHFPADVVWSMLLSFVAVWMVRRIVRDASQILKLKRAPANFE
ncbi:MAG: phosphatase PAP2 family protein [Rickettsiales bacterium]|nr:phosphatase PAP2 family protein [Rickettsiales bacterium]